MHSDFIKSILTINNYLISHRGKKLSPIIRKYLSSKIARFLKDTKSKDRPSLYHLQLDQMLANH